MNKVENSIIKVILVDDHPLIRQGIKNTFNNTEIEIIGEAPDADRAIELIGKNRPHLVVADISLQGSADGIDLVKAIKERYPEVKTLILSMHNESRYIEKAIKAGTNGYVTKKQPLEIVVEAIKSIMNGDLYISTDVSGKVIHKLMHVSSSNKKKSSDIFTDREFEIFSMIGNGYASSEIAHELDVSVNTIESHKRNIKEKLGLTKSSELLKQAIQWGKESLTK